MAYLLVNRLVTPTGTPDMTLNGSVNNSVTSFVVNAVPSNLGTGGDVMMLCYAVGDVNAELVKMTSRASTTLTVVRAAEEASALPAAAHANAAGLWIVQTAGSTRPAIYEATLSGDVSLTTTSTVYDGPTLSLPAGNYSVRAYGAFLSNNATATVSMGIYDGTNVVRAVPFVHPGSVYFNLAVEAKISLSSLTTIKLQTVTDSGNSGKKLLQFSPLFSGTVLGTTLIAEAIQ